MAFPRASPIGDDASSLRAPARDRVRERSHSGPDRAPRNAARGGDEKPTDRRPLANDFGRGVA
jgi:hypothetical protein